MTLGVLEQRREHDWQNDLNIIADQVAEVFIVPEVECTLGDLGKKKTVSSLRNYSAIAISTHLEMRACNRLGQLLEEWLLDFGKFRRVHHLEDVFHFVKVHNFLGAVGFRPVSQQTEDHLKAVRKG